MPNIVPSAYAADILAQPQALSDTLSGFEIIPELLDLAAVPRHQRTARLVLTGMGGSYFVFYPLYYRLITAGLAPVLIETSELINEAAALLGPKTVVVAASQSGRSGEIVRLVELARERACPVLAVSNTPDSPLALGAAASLFTHAGAENTVSCKTYTTMLVAMELLGDLMLKGRSTHRFASFHRLPEVVERYLRHWEGYVAELTAILSGAAHLFYVGRGPSLAAAGVAGLTTKESTHFHAEGMSSAAFRHGPLEMAGPQTAVAIFAGLEPARALNHRLAEDLRRLRARVLWIDDAAGAGVLRLPLSSSSDSIRSLYRPILEILPAQLMTLALAQLCGHTAGEFSHASKVTASE
jgi:glucosamine--fructose-6-phosphate aminotransferase (isomerizing)